ncbi:ABC transporter permease [Kitasatospora sp. NPDC053057]|uniref:ABC transporter permease n=1 Tax=Kitasatospora sp. NPDC053057 TaxID=3364062 RepID=UPI0037C6BAA6
MTKGTAAVPAVPPLEPKARFGDLVAAEWIKLWSLRSTPWAFAATVVLTLTITVFGAIADAQHYTGYDADHKAYFRSFGTLADAFSRGASTMVIVGAGAIGAITVLGECTTGMIRTTFAAVPARTSVMAAKLAVVTAATTLLGVACAFGSYAAAQAVLAGQDVAVGLGHPGMMRLLLASVLLAPVSALVGMGLAAVIRHSVLTIVATIALLFVVPSMLDDRSHFGVSLVHMTIPQAWDRLGHAPASSPQWPWTVWGAFLVLAVWVLVAAALTVFTTNHRDQ